MGHPHFLWGWSSLYFCGSILSKYYVKKSFSMIRIKSQISFFYSLGIIGITTRLGKIFIQKYFNVEMVFLLFCIARMFKKI
jgi:hypothetical protein